MSSYLLKKKKLNKKTNKTGHLWRIAGDQIKILKTDK